MRKHPVMLGLIILFSVGFLLGLAVYFLTGHDLERLTSKGVVGVVKIEGVISSSDDIVGQLQDFSADDNIKAVVLRINSPGGGVVPSQEIYQAVCELKKKKKVVASMGTIAASGGYLVAAAADTIVANPGSITGSISAIMHFADVHELIDKIGIHVTSIKSGRFKDIGSPVREMTKEERQLLQEVVDDIYDQILHTIAENRKIPIDSLKKISDGRIFSGRQAASLKLIDKLGGLQDAVQLAADMAGIKKKPIVVYAKKKETPFWKFLLENASSTALDEMRSRIGGLFGASYLIY